MKMDLLLYYQIWADIVANVTMGLVASALILMFYGDIPTTVTPSQAASGLILYALCLAVYRMIRASILTHTGDWFVCRAKHAISKMAEFKSSDEEADIMANVVATRNLFITSWVGSSSNLMTEIIGVCVIAAFNVKLFFVGAALVVFGKVKARMARRYILFVMPLLLTLQPLLTPIFAAAELHGRHVPYQGAGEERRGAK